MLYDVSKDGRKELHNTITSFNGFPALILFTRAFWVGYARMVGDAGLEPTYVGVKVPCLTDLANPLWV